MKEWAVASSAHIAQGIGADPEVSGQWVLELWLSLVNTTLSVSSNADLFRNSVSVDKSPCHSLSFTIKSGMGAQPPVSSQVPDGCGILTSSGSAKEDLREGFDSKPTLFS